VDEYNLFFQGYYIAAQSFFRIAITGFDQA